MSNMPVLSIIIPAYNSERYLSRCLDSLICESIMKYVEIIIVNDGSKDRTSEIAHSYEDRYPVFFNVIDKENGNYGSVMNVGLKNAKGKYFKTLDSDDWYDTKALESYINELKDTNADIIINDYVRYQEADGSTKTFHVNNSVENSMDIVINKEIWTTQVLKNYNIHSICYKTELLRKSGIKWPERVFYSDMQTILWPQRFCKTVRFVPQPVYVYLEGRKEQSMNIESKKRNFHSYDIVANNLLDEFIKYQDINHPMYLVQESNVLYILKQFYSYLTYTEFKDFDRIRSLDLKLTQLPHIYTKVGDNLIDRGFAYVKEFRKEPLPIKFYLYRTRLYLSRIKKRLS
ncbi:MAG: glycosyltransferase family 2 protein [Prevotella sp.]|nr:glycosyltransferase family 2 protein [Prevotella sp.]